MAQIRLYVNKARNIQTIRREAGLRKLIQAIKEVHPGLAPSLTLHRQKRCIQLSASNLATVLAPHPDQAPTLWWEPKLSQQYGIDKEAIKAKFMAVFDTTPSFDQWVP